MQHYERPDLSPGWRNLLNSIDQEGHGLGGGFDWLSISGAGALAFCALLLAVLA